MRACLATLLAAGLSFAAPVPNQKEVEPAEKIAGVWVQTAVVYGGDDLFAPPGTGNQMMTFDGKKYREHLKSGRTITEGEFKLVKGKGGLLELDLPGTVVVRGPRNLVAGFRAVTHAAIVKFDGKDGMSICYSDPDLVEPGTKRPSEFGSTATNRVVQITLKRKP